MKTITVSSRTHGTKSILVDDCDYEMLSRYTWSISKSDNTFYAMTRNEFGKNVKMHRMIMSPESHYVVDHIDHNGLNNQRDNLRIVSTSENFRNRKNTRSLIGERLISKEQFTKILSNGEEKRYNTFSVRFRRSGDSKQHRIRRKNLSDAIEIRNQILKEHYNFFPISASR